MVDSDKSKSLKTGSLAATSTNGASTATQSKVQQIVDPADQPTRAGIKAYKVLGSRFELPEQYEIIDPVGSGAYGVVVAAKDKAEDD
jgi:hypothetical protein